MPIETRDGRKVLVVRDDYPANGRDPKKPPGPNPRQIEFFDRANEREAEEILFAGSIRAGKTQAACKQITAWAWQYGGTYLICRKTYRELEDSTKKAFLRGDGPMPPGCPPELVKEYRATDNMVILQNGAEVLFRSLEHPREAEDKIKNITLAGFFIDQVEELDSDEYFQLYLTMLGRLSDPRGPRKSVLVANPGPETHWVYERFVDEFSREEQTRYVHVTIFDNEDNLPPSYVANMKKRERTQPDWYRRFILGEWGQFGGKRFKWWDPKIHVVDPNNIQVLPGWEVIEGIDYGWSNPTCVLWVAITYEGRWYVIAEHFEEGKPISYHARTIWETRKRLRINPTATYLDPSAFSGRGQYESIAMEFFDYDIHPVRAQNDRVGGWNRIEEMLGREMPDGLPQLQIFSSCKNLIRELPNLKTKDRPGGGRDDDVEKDRDHSADALRYAIMSRMPVPDVIEEEDDHNWRRRDYWLARKARERIEDSQRIYVG